MSLTSLPNIRDNKCAVIFAFFCFPKISWNTISFFNSNSLFSSIFSPPHYLVNCITFGSFTFLTNITKKFELKFLKKSFLIFMNKSFCIFIIYAYFFIVNNFKIISFVNSHYKYSILINFNIVFCRILSNKIHIFSTHFWMFITLFSKKQPLYPLIPTVTKRLFFAQIISLMDL